MYKVVPSRTIFKSPYPTKFYIYFTSYEITLDF